MQNTHGAEYARNAQGTIHKEYRRRRVPLEEITYGTLGCQ